MRKIKAPQIAVAGLSLELYHNNFKGFDKLLTRQFDLFCNQIKPYADIRHAKICFLQGHVEDVIKEAEALDVNALLLMPLCYTASLMTLRPILRTSLPLIIWNTQEAESINDNYDFDVLLKNHVAQGTQDLTNVLLRNNKIFGMESGHYRDKNKLEKLGEWFRATRAFRFAKCCNVGLLGLPFQDMGDFGVDETAMLSKWGPYTVHLSVGRLVELINKVTDKEIRKIVGSDKKNYDISPELTDDIHCVSARLEIAMRQLVEENKLDALSMNFRELISDGRIPAMPFLGINKMMGEGLGYAGEGNVTVAALMAQMRQLAGVANFTEIYTVDYKQNLMIMTHMQECNPAMARKDTKIKLIKKDFWAEGMGPYVGMHFTLEPGPVTLVNITTNSKGEFFFIVYETEIMNRGIFKKFDIPHWVIKLDEPVGDFLNRYSLAGGTHHLAAMPGRHAAAVAKLATFHSFELKILRS
jgi:L-arabinose isomerase